MRTIALFTTAFLLAAAPLNADVLFGTTVANGSARASDYGVNDQFGFRTFDDFVLGSGATVQTVAWRGFWLGGLQPAAPPMPDVTTWEIAFYADAGGAPGAQLQSQTFQAAAVTSTLLGFGPYFIGQDQYNVAYYDYAVTLPQGFAAAAGQAYWLSVFARSPTFSPLFAWRGASTGLGNYSVQHTLGAGESVTQIEERALNRAFTLEGTVPEPATLLLVGSALLGVAARRRRTGQA